MITLIYNDERREEEEGITLFELLEKRGIDPHTAKGIAVSYNYCVAPKQRWKEMTLQEGDQIHLLKAIQGG